MPPRSSSSPEQRARVAHKKSFNNTLLPVKKYGTNYQRDWVLMVTAAVEIWTAQLGAITGRKQKHTASFPPLLFCFCFFFFSLHERCKTHQSYESTTSFSSHFKLPSNNRPSGHAASLTTLRQEGLFTMVSIKGEFCCFWCEAFLTHKVPVFVPDMVISVSRFNATERMHVEITLLFSKGTTHFLDPD